MTKFTNSRRAFEQGREDSKLLEVFAEAEQLEVDFSAAATNGHVTAGVDVEGANEGREVVLRSIGVLGILDGVAGGMLGRLERTEKERRLPGVDQRDAVEKCASVKGSRRREVGSSHRRYSFLRAVCRKGRERKRIGRRGSSGRPSGKIASSSLSSSSS